jgi:hypothetical protein
MWRSYAEITRMLLNLFVGLFHKRCPVCKQEAHEQSGASVRRFGKWYCSEMHADLYELTLYEALRTVYCRHVGCHGAHVPLPEAVGIDCSPWQNPVLAHFEEDRRR